MTKDFLILLDSVPYDPFENWDSPFETSLFHSPCTPWRSHVLPWPLSSSSSGSQVSGEALKFSQSLEKRCDVSPPTSAIGLSHLPAPGGGLRPLMTAGRDERENRSARPFGYKPAGRGFPAFNGEERAGDQHCLSFYFFWFECRYKASL